MVIFLIIVNLITILWAAYKINELEERMDIISIAAKTLIDSLLSFLKEQSINDKTD